ncbi:MAG: AraC family transcriptional regulator [Gammaproteobacteria bacterium]|nr:AraC family transcriptional regulator [Gammaproteobacteria bacterium]
MKPVMPKAVLRKVIKRFLQDKDRGISVALFAELAGISVAHLKDVFLHENEPLTEYIQRRVNKAYFEWQDGEVAIMQNRDKTRFVQYRKEAKPIMEKKTTLQVVNGKIALKIGIAPKYDYSKSTLDEQLERG